MSQKSYRESGGILYLVPTPIGNMEDMTYRAVNTLEKVSLVLCEDTRVTEQLLTHFSIHKPLYSCHEHNEIKMIDFVLKHLKDGEEIALVTDRGTPIISDPGYRIVSSAIDMGYSVIGLPGPTAFVPALITSGLSPAPFLFFGFLNAKNKKREEELQCLSRLPYTLIFYESPHRIEATLDSLQKVLGDRKISLSREISKRYEEIYRGKISEVQKETKNIKGEIVLVVSGNTTPMTYENLSVVDHIKLYLEDGISEMEAIKKVAQERHTAKSIIYQEYIKGKR